MDFPEHVEKIISWSALPSVIVRIFGDALTPKNKRPVIPIAIKHDSLPFGQPCNAVLRNLLGDDEVWGTGLDHPGFKLNQPVEKLCGNVGHDSLPSF